MKIKTNFLKNYYKECWQEIKKTKAYIIFATSMFLLSIIIGFFFPYGIFEIPAIILSISFGIKLGMSVFNKNPIKKLKENFIKSAKIFLLIIAPLLLIAAFIEGIMIILAS